MTLTLAIYKVYYAFILLNKILPCCSVFQKVPQFNVTEDIREVRILCIVIIRPNTKDDHVRSTWGKRCNNLIFKTTENSKKTATLKATFEYAYENYRNETDWFLKVYDDSYVIIDNLRAMLSGYKSKDAIYFGLRVTPNSNKNQSYMHSDAGYVLSNEALYRLVTGVCDYTIQGSEGMKMGACLDKVGAKAMDSRDALNRERFLPFLPERNIYPYDTTTTWIRKHSYYPIAKGIECCSNSAITLNRVKPKNMYVMEYLIYHLQPFGIWQSTTYQEPLPTTIIPQNTLRLQELEKQNLRSAYKIKLNRPIEEVAKEVRIACLVLTHLKNHETKARHIKNTWGRRCNKLIFMSSAKDSSLPAVKLPIKYDNREVLWNKTKAAFKYVYEHHWNDAEWFMKADDDTYVILENLRYLLSEYNTNDPIYFGLRLNAGINQENYMDGGAGYVLSREALGRFVTSGLLSPDKCCPSSFGAEDMKMGHCLYNLEVQSIDTRDYLNRQRFLMYTPYNHFYINKSSQYWLRTFYPLGMRYECCSTYAISFHYIKPKEMYTMDYLIYMSPSGMRSGDFEPIINTTKHSTSSVKM